MTASERVVLEARLERKDSLARAACMYNEMPSVLCYAQMSFDDC